MSVQPYVRTFEVLPYVVGIEFFHPQSNSLPAAVLAELADTIARVAASPATRVILLQSGGERAFCGGASFDELSAIATPEQGQQFFMGFARVINAMRLAPQPVMVRVQGRAVGGGVGIASAADYCMATVRAEVKLSELAVGIGPFVIGPAVERKMGLAAFQHMALHATAFHSAEWAQQCGLYAQVHADMGALDAALLELAQQLAASNPDALRALKQVCWQGTDHWDSLLAQRAAISGTLVCSAFTREAIARFKARAAG